MRDFYDIEDNDTQVAESNWLSLSDMMAGLMIIFLFIALIYIRVETEGNDDKNNPYVLRKQLKEHKKTITELNNTNLALQQELQISDNTNLALQQELQISDNTNLALQQQLQQSNAQQKKLSEILLAWEDEEQKIYEDLLIEFSPDLPRWNAEITKDLLIRFNAPDVLFKKGDAALTQKYHKILDNFFPRYVRVLRPYRHIINEIRIEGHTDSKWTSASSKKEAFINNMLLSQSRTRAVLIHVLNSTDNASWVNTLLTANGLSSSRPIFYPGTKTENPKASRRVEFRVRTKIRDMIYSAYKKAGL